MRSSVSHGAGAIAAALLIDTLGAASPTAAPAPAYRETLAGTIVSFEMVPVARGTVTIDGNPVTVEPFQIGRTEVTRDMHVGHVRRLRPRPG